MELQPFTLPGECTPDTPFGALHVWQWAESQPRDGGFNLVDYLASVGFVTGRDKITESEYDTLHHALDHFARVAPWHAPVKLSDAFPSLGDFWLNGRARKVSIAPSIVEALERSGWIYDITPDSTYFQVTNGRLFAKYQQIIGSRCIARVLPEQTIMTTSIGTIATTRLRNSLNGNGSFRIVLVTEGGDIVEGRTAPNSQFTYTMPRDGRAVCRWHETPTGRVVFDDIAAA